MKSIKGLLTKLLAVALSVMMIVSVMPLQSSALSYPCSSSYVNGTYYQQLLAVNLTGNQRVDIVNVALSQEGYLHGNNTSQLHGHTNGSYNYTEYGRWYGMYDLWCAMFVSWCAYVAGVSSSIVTYHAYTPSGLSWFINQGRAYSQATIAAGGYSPIPGDIIYFKSPRNSNITNHVGIVTGFSGSTIYTVEGNTSPATNSTDGGQVRQKSYSMYDTYIVYVCRPAYTSGDSYTTSSYQNTIDMTGGGTKLNGTVTASTTVSRDDGTFNIAGWSVHSEGVSGYQYSLNNSSWNDLGNGFRQDVADATLGSFPKCTDINCFSHPLSLAGFAVGTNVISLRGVTKSGNTYAIGTINVFVKPSASETTLELDASAMAGVASNGKLIVTAQGARSDAWVGLFAASDTPGSVKSYMYYEMGSNLTTFDLISQGTSTDRGELTPGDYKIVLFVDTDYTVDKTVNVKITAPNKSSLDAPSSTTYADAGTKIHTAGWALHESGINKITAVIDGTTEIELSKSERPDVIAAYPEYASLGTNVGFADEIDTTNFSVGTHYVTIYAYPNSADRFAVSTFAIVTYDTNTSLVIEDTNCEIGSTLNVTATSQNPDAWIGLYLLYDDITAATPFFSCKVSDVGSGVKFNMFEAAQQSSERDFVADDYVVVLFKDAGTTIDKDIAVKISDASTFYCAYDYPQAETYVYQGNTTLVRGWGLANVGITQFELTIDGGTPTVLPTVHRDDVLAVDATLGAVCADTHAYNYDCPTSDLSVGKHEFTVHAVLTTGVRKQIGSMTVNIEARPEDLQLTVVTGSNSFIDRSGSFAVVYGVNFKSDTDSVKALFNEECEIIGLDGKTATALVGTGYKVVRYDDNGNKVDEIVVIIGGDLDGDAMCTSKDIIRAKLALNGNANAAPYAAAIDVSGDGINNSNDLKHMAQLCSIN